MLGVGLLLLGVLLVAGVPIQSDGTKRAASSARAVKLLAPQGMTIDTDLFVCEEGCSAQKFCMPGVCSVGEACETEPVPCDGDWSCKAKECAKELRSELCADVSGEPCENRLGVDKAMIHEGKNTSELEVPDGTCISILVGTTHYWCAETCKIREDCPPNICRCADDFEQMSSAEGAASKAKKLEDLMAAACDFDAIGCVENSFGSQDCRACYLHFDGCVGNPHYEDDGVTPKDMDLDACMDLIAATSPECSTCGTPESKEGYKVRKGIHDPPEKSK
jgi:hypothetical protein